MKVLRDVWLVYIFFTSVFIRNTLSCNGYSLTLNSVKNCGKNQVIQMDDKFEAVLDKNCNVIPKGCGSVTRPFNTLALKYTISKPPLSDLDGTLDVCKLPEQRPMVVALANAFALPTKCPVTKAKRFCVNGDKRFNIGKFRAQMGFLAGNTKIKLEGTHDTGKSCILIDITLSKKE